MYYAVIVLLMLVLPAGSAIIELLLTPQAWVPVAGKWFVFWAVGIRLLIAGARQVANPSFTAGLLKIEGTASHIVIRELGFANLAIGLTAALSLAFSGWIPAAAVAGAIFYATIGVQHVFSRDRSTSENWAMGSDLFAAIVLVLYLLLSLLSRTP